MWLTGPSGLHRNSPQGLSISFNRVFDQIRGPEMPSSFAPRQQFCPKAGLPLQTQEPLLQFYWGWIGAVASRSFPHPTLSFSNPPVASPTSQALHLIHLASRPWIKHRIYSTWEIHVIYHSRKFCRSAYFRKNWKLIHLKLLFYPLYDCETWYLT